MRNAARVTDCRTSLDVAFDHLHNSIVTLERLPRGKISEAEIAKVDFAFEVISSQKAKVDRLCMLSLSKEDRMAALLEHHRAIADGIKAGDAEAAVAAGMLHLPRLDATSETIFRENPHYSET